MKGWLSVLLCPAACALLASRACSSRRLVARAARRQTTLGLGCFWKPSEALLALEGVDRTVVGYCGREFEARDSPPDYQSVCDGDGSVEAVRVYFDDEIVSFESVLAAALDCSNPGRARQYAPVIFAQDEAQTRAAEAWRLGGARRADGLAAASFSVEKARLFWRAERYHQEYWQRWRPRFLFLGGLILAQSTQPWGAPGDQVCSALTWTFIAFVAWERLFNLEVLLLEE